MHVRDAVRILVLLAADFALPVRADIQHLVCRTELARGVFYSLAKPSSRRLLQKRDKRDVSEFGIIRFAESTGITKREATKMNKAKLSLLIASLYLATCGEVFAAQIWVNNSPDALVKQLEIYPNDNAVPFPGNPLSPTEGLVNITFQNDVEYIGLALHPTAGSISPSFFPSVDGNYSLFTVYYCEAGSNPAVGQTCDGIALRSENAQLCAGFFQYNTLADRVFTIADIGCFTQVGVGTVTLPRLSRRDFLQKYTKEQLIDILNGVRPINPIGPVCLSCPPWEGYGKDMAVKLQKLPVRKFRIEVKEIK
jgi:hypothetical protein